MKLEAFKALCFDAFVVISIHVCSEMLVRCNTITMWTVIDCFRHVRYVWVSGVSYIMVEHIVVYKLQIIRNSPIYYMNQG